MSVLIALCTLCVFASVYLALTYLLRPKGVPLTEEWKASHAPAGNGRMALYTVLGAAACAAVAFGVTGQTYYAVAALPGGYFVARSLIERQASARRRLLRSQYAQALNVLTAALQGGLSPYQALEDAVPSMPRPSRDVFAEILRQTRTGSTFVDAAEKVTAETGWGDLKSYCVALRLYSRTGCNLVKVFQHLVETVYERENDRRYAAAVTASMRSTAALLSFLPFVIMGAARVAAPEFAAPLFTTVGGAAVVGFCVVMVIIGNRVIGRMVKSVIGEDV
ncbi:MAG: type II secretion system F family protein [Moorellaceae bacterium]